MNLYCEHIFFIVGFCKHTKCLKKLKKNHSDEKKVLVNRLCHSYFSFGENAGH